MKDFLKMLFVATTIISPFLSNKIASIYGFTTPVGIIFATIIMFGIVDVVNYLYGIKEARKMILIGILIKLIIFIVFIPIAVHLPSAPFWKEQETFSSFLNHSIQLMLASELTVLIGQYVFDTWIFNLFRKFNWFIRVIMSDVTSQLIQTIGFVLIGYVGKDIPFFQVIISAYLLRILLSIVKSLIFYPLVKQKSFK